MRVSGNALIKLITVGVVVISATIGHGDELTLNQKLIYACFKLDIDDVVKHLRNGADVNATLGACSKVDVLFGDRWTGGLAPLGVHKWTPLLAVSSASMYPDPPVSLGEVWKDMPRSRSLREEITNSKSLERHAKENMIVNILLSHGCDIDCEDGYGATALYKAAERGKVSVVKKLLEFKANVNIKTQAYLDGPSDSTPLHVARKYQDVTKMLLDHGAEWSAEDSNGHTAIDLIKRDKDSLFDIVVFKDGPRIVLRKEEGLKRED